MPLAQFLGDNEPNWPSEDPSTDSECPPGPFHDMFLKAEEQDEGMSALEVTLAMLDWMHCHKVTDVAASSVWDLLAACMGPQCTSSRFAEAKAVLLKHYDAYVLRVDICVNDCVAFYDVRNLPGKMRKYKHAHRSKCPVCSAPRWIKDTRLAARQPRKCVYYFSIARFLSNLFNQPELIPFLYWNACDVPDSHVVNSRRFKVKVMDNEVMKLDPRNIPLIANTDGVPFFKDQLRGGWPVVLKVATLPDALGQNMRFCHIAGLQANEYLDWSEDGRRVVKHVRQPKSLQPIMTLMVDDLHRLYWSGVRVVDTSMPRSMGEQRLFVCRLPAPHFVDTFFLC